MKPPTKEAAELLRRLGPGFGLERNGGHCYLVHRGVPVRTANGQKVVLHSSRMSSRAVQNLLADLRRAGLLEDDRG